MFQRGHEVALIKSERTKPADCVTGKSSMRIFIEGSSERGACARGIFSSTKLGSRCV